MSETAGEISETGQGLDAAPAVPAAASLPMGQAPPEAPVARVHKAQINPDIDSISSLNLYEGQRVRHELVYGVVKDRKTGAYHHDYASFRTLRKTKATPWKADPKASFTLSEDKQAELSRALEFLHARRGMPPELEVSSPEPAGPGQPAEGSPPAEADLLAALAGLRAGGDLRAAIAALEQGSGEALATGALLFRIAACRRALRSFHRLLRLPGTPQLSFLELLARERWMLGHETSESLNLREFLPQARADLLLLRSPADQVELICIGTPLGEADAERLLDYDADYAGWYPGAELTIRLGQVQHALDRLEALPAESWGTRPASIRARILLGHGHGDQALESALADFARHQRLLTIQTFDQLDRFAVRSLASLQQALKEL